MTSIVISYRRADTGQIAGRIYDHLVAHFGRESVFIDIDAIPIGADFREHIRHTLDHCDIMLAVVGPRWADGGTERDRLADENDWIRIEIETALAKKIPVVPVLIDQTQLPAPADLPAGLRDLAFKQAARIDSGIDFAPHMERLLRSLDRYAAPQHTIAKPARPETDAAQERPRAAGTWASSWLDGRIGRARWWLAMGMAFAYCLVASALLFVVARLNVDVYLAVCIPAYFLFIIAGFRRLHDRGRNAWWSIPLFLSVPFIPGIAALAFHEYVVATLQQLAIVGILFEVSGLAAIWAIVDLGCLTGTPGPNRYGPDPQAKS